MPLRTLEALSQRPMHLHPCHNHVLALGRVHRRLRDHLHLLQDGLVHLVRQLHQRGHMPVRDVVDQQLLQHRLLHVDRVHRHLEPRRLELVVQQDDGPARRARRRPARPIHLAELALQRQPDVRRHPEHVPLDPVHHGRVRHRGFEARPATEAEPTQRGHVEAAAPQPVKLVREGAADLIAARRHEVYAGLGGESVLEEHVGHVLDEQAVRYCSWKMRFQEFSIPGEPFDSYLAVIDFVTVLFECCLDFARLQKFLPRQAFMLQRRRLLLRELIAGSRCPHRGVCCRLGQQLLLTRIHFLDNLFLTVDLSHRSCSHVYYHSWF
mmetsp:Transcript_43105/g.90218  ORF Transcript_43105/g.90218 Transcript_43105/m.90218 type:complete len:323 (-) Transcript_43105:514-1482(-)